MDGGLPLCAGKAALKNRHDALNALRGVFAYNGRGGLPDHERTVSNNRGSPAGPGGRKFQRRGVAVLPAGTSQVVSGFSGFIRGAGPAERRPPTSQVVSGLSGRAAAAGLSAGTAQAQRADSSRATGVKQRVFIWVFGGGALFLFLARAGFRGAFCRLHKRFADFRQRVVEKPVRA